MIEPRDGLDEAVAAMTAQSRSAPSLDQEAPEHSLFRMVSLCLEWSQRSIHRPPLQNQWLDDAELVAVGLAMRDAELLAHVGHDIRSAWEVVPYPDSIETIRREVCWELSELRRRARDREACVTDLFDQYDPTRAARRARVAAGRAKALQREGDTAGARQSEAYAALQSQIADARRQHDHRECANAASSVSGDAR